MKILFLTLISNLIFAQQNGLLFLERSNTARTISLGSQNSIISDLSNTNFNPALLLVTNSTYLQGNYSLLLFDTKQNAISVNFSNDSFYSVFHLVSHKISDIEIRENPGDYISKTSLSDLKIGLSLSKDLSDNLFLGINLNFINEKLFIDNANGFTFDFGLYKTFLDYGNISFAINNIGKMNKMRNVETILPLNYSIGFNKDFQINIFNNNFYFESTFSNNKTILKLGNEINYKFLSFRIGKQLLTQNKLFSTGFGINTDNLIIDYAFQLSNNNLGAEHIISFSILK